GPAIPRMGEESSYAASGFSRFEGGLSEERWLRIALLSRWSGRRLRRRVAQVAPRRRLATDESLHAPLHLTRRVCPAAVDLLVHRHEIRTLGLEPVEEDLAHLAAQVQG